MDGHSLLARLESVKHYFLLDQGDFFVHFLDSAEEELTKPVSEKHLVWQVGQLI